MKRRLLKKYEKKVLLLLVAVSCCAAAFAQQNVVVKGAVTDSVGTGLINATIRALGTGQVINADSSGNFQLSVPKNELLEVSAVGYKAIQVAIARYKADNDKGIFVKVVLLRENKAMDEVVVVGYGTQKKTTVVSSVTTINPKELKGPTSNLTTMLAGKIPGMISFQTTGEPGKDNASFFVRGIGTFGSGKVDPLILIDNIESSTTDLARLQPDNIAGFSVLKDATATAVYGARGANGVVLVSTKTGQIGKLKFNVRLENSASKNTKSIGLADNVSYMKLANEAVLTRNPLGAILYPQTKIDHTAAGDDPLLYPSNNWIQQLIKNTATNQRANVNISGGGDKAKYYVGLSYNLDNGNIKNNSLNGFNNNIKLQSYSVLSNVTLTLTKTTEALISLKGQFDDYNGPIAGKDEAGHDLSGGATVYNYALYGNPVSFPAIYPASYMPYAKHPLFGNAVVPGSSALYTNPYAISLSGYQGSNTSTMSAQLNLKQNFDFITQGLSANAMAYTTRYANFSVTRAVSPYYYSPNIVDGKLQSISLINDGSNGNPFPVPTEYLTYAPGDKNLNTTFYGQASLNYNRTFNAKHAVGGMLVGILRNYLTGNATSLQLSLPSRNEGVSGRFTYGYDSRYLAEFDFGYNGTERFAQNHRFGFFPSVGGGWVVSNEKFFQPLLNVVNSLKFRFTYGLVGNDQIGDANDRFFYLSNVSLNGAAAGGFGTNFNYSRNTVSTSRYANTDITWEQSQQTNIGMDLTLLHDLKLTVDAYHQYRTNILMYRYTIPVSMGLQATPAANVGKAGSSGIDVALDYLKTLNNSLWIQARGTFTYARSKVLVNEEPAYAANNANLSHVGHSMAQIYGLVAEKLFIDQTEVNNSPTQFGNVLAGDIKYRDINGDGKITTSDYVPMGYPSVPEIQYGGGFSVGYKSFDISAFFQGTGRVSFMIDPIKISPFYNQHGLLDIIAKDHWSEDNRNAYAFWPRLNINSDAVGSAPTYNNNYASSWWLRNGAFLRLKSAEIGYNLSGALLRRSHLASARIYVNGTNLLTFSAFKLWDPEMVSSGLGYPIQKVYNIGVLLGL
ncbi:MAG: TonB-dependent receptor [Niabella sp.]|nr:TonB-dependent receptor [Niabella sp.]